jgi:Flp pilus assembly pilin Flp
VLQRIKQIHPDSEDGQTMAEYALVLGVIATAAVAAIALLAIAIAGNLNDVISVFSAVIP